MEKKPYKINVMEERIKELEKTVVEKDNYIEKLIAERDYYKAQCKAEK